MELPRYLQPHAACATALGDDETAAYRALVGRWLIDMALLLDWAHPGPRRHELDPRGRRSPCWDNDDFMALTGLSGRAGGDGDSGELEENRPGRSRSPARFVRLIKARRKTLARAALDPGWSLIRNLGLLADLLALDEAEQASLCFAVLLEADRAFEHAIICQSQPASTRLFQRLLAGLTGLPAEAFRAALKPDGTLRATGLIKFDDRNRDLEDKIKTEHSNVLLAPHADAEALMARFLKRSPRRTLTAENFPHLARDAEAATGLLRAALADKIAGTNLLLHGPPGTGKTEFAAVLAGAVGAELYEVDYADEDGDPIRGERRLRAFNLCQRLLARRDNALLLFDEVEDVFERDPLARLFGGEGDGATAGKAWINRALESGPVPALWLTNDAGSMGGAYLRRFDYSIRFEVPPRSVRAEIARHHLGEWAGEDGWLAEIAAREHLTPAQLERAAKVARHAGDGGLEGGRALVLQALERSAALLGQKRAPARNSVPTGYDVRFLNVDLDVPRLIAALRRRPQGIFCFHGPAGTGKSELARHLADRLEKPLSVQRASDLLDPHVGGTEKRLAAMFDDARQREAVLVLDEADSFLRDRRGARQSWEVTQVNELLTQMEAFEGIFICTTNRMESLDAASLRRFPWKIRFDYLKPAQRWGLFVQEFARMGGEIAQALPCKDAVLDLERLAPGDVAAVVRQFELWDKTPDVRDFYRRVAAEVAAKESRYESWSPARVDRGPTVPLYG